MDEKLVAKYLTGASRIVIDNPIVQDDKCTLLSTRRDKYYKFRYEGGKIKEYLAARNIDYSNVDTNDYDNCCNCISYVLYTIFFEKPFLETVKKLDLFITCLYQSVKNAANSAPDWLVRIYMDKSVYQLIDVIDQPDYVYAKFEQASNVRKTIKQVPVDYELWRNLYNIIAENEYSYIKSRFQDILNSPNVEVYTFDCNWGDKLSKTRSLRFLPLISQDTNIVASREADGILSNLDCLNLQIYQNKPDFKFYFINLFGLIYKEPFTGYSSWMKIYKRMLRPDFFSQNIAPFDLTAGTFATKIKISKEYYLSMRVELTNKISDLLATPNIVENPNIKYLFVKRETDVLELKSVIDTLNIGFDEIILCDIYKELILDINNFEIIETIYFYNAVEPLDNSPEYLVYKELYEPDDEESYKFTIANIRCDVTRFRYGEIKEISNIIVNPPPDAMGNYYMDPKYGAKLLIGILSFVNL